MDASNVPGEYALTILSECAAFPRRLVFFLKGQLEVSRRYHFQLEALRGVMSCSVLRISSQQQYTSVHFLW